jgi:carbon-monoxide dehydrogenase large subunit
MARSARSVVGTPARRLGSATVKIDPSGKVTVMREHLRWAGRGRRRSRKLPPMSWASYRRILVLHGDTAIVQYGIGTFGSRGTAVGGTAVYFALQDLKAKIKKFGAMLLGSEDVTFSGGQVMCNKTGASKTLQEIAGATYRAMTLPANTEPGLFATHFWEPPNFTFPFGAHMVITDIDRETGEQIRALSRHGRCGNILNPLIAS